MSTWYENWFESPWYIKLYRHRTEEEAREAIDVVRHIAHLPIGARVLDLACGYGRHAMSLAEAGYQVVGLDGSKYLIERANEVFSHPNVHYVVADMRGPFLNAPFNAVVSFFTSFGYFDTPEEDAEVIRSVHHALVGGGLFVLDFFNAHHVREHLEPESLSMIDNATVIQERSIRDGFVHKRITINVPCSHEREYSERVRLYSRDELVEMITATGLVIDQIMGDYDGTEFEEMTSARCIIIARKP